MARGEGAGGAGGAASHAATAAGASVASDRVKVEMLHRPGDIVYGQTADGRVWVAQIKGQARVDACRMQPHLMPAIALHALPSAWADSL